jgi:hypothetical protein
MLTLIPVSRITPVPKFHLLLLPLFVRRRGRHPFDLPGAAPVDACTGHRCSGGARRVKGVVDTEGQEVGRRVDENAVGPKLSSEVSVAVATTGGGFQTIAEDGTTVAVDPETMALTITLPGGQVSMGRSSAWTDPSPSSTWTTATPWNRSPRTIR